MQQPERGAGEVLGAFVADTDPGAIAPPLRHEAKRALLNFLGCALGVSRDPAVTTAIGVLRPFSGAATATLVGQAARLDAMGAAFVNTVAGNLLDYDDTHLATVIHPTAAVAGAALALAETRGLPGAALLHAFLLGAEVECRIGLAVSPGHYARGWHITSTCGVFGAAAACARLLGLDAAGCATALGIAASQSAGLVENLSYGAKNVGMGNAARNGLLAALFAEAGYTAAPTAIEGKLGWARAMGDVPRLPDMLDGLGERWEFARNTYKPYPSGIVFHALIDACLALRERLGAAVGGIESVTVRGDQLLLDRGDRVVRTARDSRVSIHHGAAVALLRGRAGVPEFEDGAVWDPAVAALRGRVRAVLDDAMPRGAVAVTVALANGRSETVRVEAARGSLEQPLSDAELEAKFRDNAALGGTTDAASAQIAAVWGLEEAGALGRLLGLMAGRA
ncbi:MmgE/PrpD family protein [Roseomonas sp. NAR14]|uniref:MmgE/PrpD family protein n=1 Tax=Roseomonas acroporae TaxID=2937791 RepID=A0A9X2BWG5_9PROT|nr:MmgE/PrpD family protein [Roseomonas acroporae]MCK8787662.1 MmgE/PrpD family protein [Roseomonas acroporae]